MNYLCVGSLYIFRQCFYVYVTMAIEFYMELFITICLFGWENVSHPLYLTNLCVCVSYIKFVN